MVSDSGHSVLRPLAVGRHPIYSVFLPIPIICFVGALITDLAYIGSFNIMWLDFSTWLLLAGLIGGGIAGVLLIIELVRARGSRHPALSAHFVVLLSAWIVEVLNSFIHARDGWTAVMPTGLALSIFAALLSVLAGWLWQSAAFRRNGAAR